MTESVRDAIVAANEAFMAATRQGDAAGVAALYTTDGKVLPPNADFVTGHQAIQALFQSLMDMGIAEIRLETAEVEAQGDTAFEVSTYALLGREGQELDRGKYIVVWKNEDGQWKLHRDIFNSSLPTSS
jgi:uncharacterized protein (TIGR02246 family)